MLSPALSILPRVSSAHAQLADIDNETASLSCQEAALMARVAGAEGLEHGEQARAAAAAAEAAGLKVNKATTEPGFGDSVIFVPLVWKCANVGMKFF